MRTLSDRRDLLIGLLRSLGAASSSWRSSTTGFPTWCSGAASSRWRRLFIIALVAGWRIAFEWLSLRGQPTERLLIVGTSAGRGRPGARAVRAPHELGVELVGFVDSDPARVGDRAHQSRRHRHRQADIPTIVREPRSTASS
jgi:hypothetical protein